MNGDYSILEKSMNGIKTLSDGISIISNGIATHENVYYNEFIKSDDEKTILLNNSVTTENIYVDNLNATDIISDEVSTSILNCDYLYVNDVNNPLQDVLEVDGNLKKLKLYGQGEFRDTVSVINTNVSQTQGGTIQQTGTNFNTLKDTKINGFIEIGSNITQTGGSTTLKDVVCDNITMNSNKGITQSGTGVSNTLGTSTITNLTITGSVTFPSEVEIPGTTTSDDIVMNGSSVITQDTTVSTTKFNKLRYTKTLDLDVIGDLSMTEAGTTATLKNTVIEGTTELQGDIEQTAGFTKLNTIECNNITLRVNNDINLSGTGKISQTGTGVNSMNAITLNNNQNITFNGSGIISQALSGTNILSHFRTAGFGIVGGRNNTTFNHTQNIQNNNGLQLQYNRDNSTFYSYLMNNRSGAGGGFRFQRYNAGVYVDEPMVIDDNITMNKNVNIAGGSLTCSSATIGAISQTELNCLDNCNTNIQTKFNNLDAQIASLETTTSGVTSNTTGITYNTGSDTTTIDNNLIVSSGKSLTLGTTNINSFITDTNTFIVAASNNLQGVVYTAGNDTTTINNNVNITGSLVVQGMNIKEEIDALETSFTTGTLNTTNLTAGTINITNQLNFTNPTVSNRYINNLGGLTFSDWVDNSFSMQVYNSGLNHFIISEKNNGEFSFLGRNSLGVATNRKLTILSNANATNYNPTTTANDVLLFASNPSIETQSLNLTVWSNTKTGVRIEPTKTTISGGNNNIDISSNNGIVINGNTDINGTTTINNFNTDDEFTKIKKVENRTNIYYPLSYTNTELNNVLAFQFTTNPRFYERIYFSCPISHSRTFQILQTFPIWAQVDETINVNMVITKNDVPYITQNGIMSNINQTIRLETEQPTSFQYTYELFIGTLNYNFLPDYDDTNSNVYKVYINWSGSYTWATSSGLAFQNRSSYLKSNTNITTSSSNSTILILTGVPAFTEPSGFYSELNYITNTDGEYTQFTAPIVATNATIQGCDTNTLSFVNANGGSLNVSSITGINAPSRWSCIPAYYIDNAIGNNFQLQNFMKPIYSSYRAMSAIDDAFIVYPDFILVVYYYAGYNILAGQSPWSGTNDTTRQTRTIDNSNGTTPIFITSQNLYGSSNQVQSCRVYYKSLSNELQLPYFSYSV